MKIKRLSKSEIYFHAGKLKGAMLLGSEGVSRPVIEQSARDSHQGPSREIPGVQAGCALVDTTVLRALQTEGSGVPATIGGGRQVCRPAWRDGCRVRRDTQAFPFSRQDSLARS